MSGIVGEAGSKSGLIGKTELEYEEGTWTPIIADTADGDQMGHSSQLASYRKIGKLVFICGIIITNNLASASGAIRMQGLPFAPSSNQLHSTGCISFGNAQGHNLGGDYTITGRVNHTDAIINLYKWSAGGGTTSVTAAEWVNTGEGQFGGTYMTDI